MNRAYKDFDGRIKAAMKGQDEKGWPRYHDVVTAALECQQEAKEFDGQLMAMTAEKEKLLEVLSAITKQAEDFETALVENRGKIREANARAMEAESTFLKDEAKIANLKFELAAMTTRAEAAERLLREIIEPTGGNGGTVLLCSVCDKPVYSHRPGCKVPEVEKFLKGR